MKTVIQFKLRWPISHPAFIQNAEAGSLVEASEFTKTTMMVDGIEWKGDVVITKAGKVPVTYLQYPSASSGHIIETSVSKAIAQSFGSEKLIFGTFWIGRVTPAHAGHYIATKTFDQGSYVVCQPPEWEPVKGWAEFCLAVRTYTGYVDQMIHEWKDTEYYNLRFEEKLGAPRPQLYDIIPAPNGPMSHVAFFIIKRGAVGTPESGYYYIEESHKFPILEQLLFHYESHLLPRYTLPSQRNKLALHLRQPAPANTNPSMSPRPPLSQAEPYYLHAKQKFVMDTEEKLEKFHAGCMKPIYQYKLEDDDCDNRKQAYFYIEGKFRSVVVRRIQYFNKKGFERDMTVLHELSGNNYAKKVADAKIPAANVFHAGSQFVPTIVAAGETSQFGPWVAYDTHMGKPLNIALASYRYNGIYLPPRFRYEIMYQVCAGMRYLEAHNLCHRSLRANNIDLYIKGNYHPLIKIADYMIPFHVLEVTVVEEMDMTELHWPWMAPECLTERLFDIWSDVWAFGCTIFEIMNYGWPPYYFEEPPLQDAHDLIRFVDSGKKLKMSEEEGEETFIDDLVSKCMRIDPRERPTFEYMFNFFKDLLYDYKNAPEKAVSKYLGEMPDKFERPYKRFAMAPEKKHKSKHHKDEKETKEGKEKDGKEGKEKKEEGKDEAKEKTNQEDEKE